MAITRRSFPAFKLTGSVELTVIRPGTPQLVNGRKVNVPPTSHTIIGNVQPAKPRDLWLLPEADRNKQWLHVMCDPCQDIRGALEGANGHDADILIWRGEYFKVMRISEWSMGVLDHITALVARVPHSAGYKVEEEDNGSSED